MFLTADSEGCIWALSNSFFIAAISLYWRCSSLSQSRALSISFVSSGEVSLYRRLIRSCWVKTFIIGIVIVDSNHFFAKVDYRIAHPPQSRIDAHPCAVGNLLKTHLQIVSHDQYFFLLIGQLFDQ